MKKLTIPTTMHLPDEVREMLRYLEAYFATVMRYELDTDFHVNIYPKKSLYDLFFGVATDPETPAGDTALVFANCSYLETALRHDGSLREKAKKLWRKLENDESFKEDGIAKGDASFNLGGSRIRFTATISDRSHHPVPTSTSAHEDYLDYFFGVTAELYASKSDHLQLYREYKRTYLEFPRLQHSVVMDVGTPDHRHEQISPKTTPMRLRLPEPETFHAIMIRLHGMTAQVKDMGAAEPQEYPLDTITYAKVNDSDLYALYTGKPVPFSLVIPLDDYYVELYTFDNH